MGSFQETWNLEVTTSTIIYHRQRERSNIIHTYFILHTSYTPNHHHSSPYNYSKMVSFRLQQLPVVLVALSLFARHESVVAFVTTPHPTTHHHHWTLRDTAADANGATTDSAAATTTTTTTKMSAVELSSQTGTTAIFTSEDIDRILPHRYPFALVDRVVSYEAGKSAIGIKSVTKVRVLFSFILLASGIG